MNAGRIPGVRMLTSGASGIWEQMEGAVREERDRVTPQQEERRNRGDKRARADGRTTQKARGLACDREGHHTRSDLGEFEPAVAK